MRDEKYKERCRRRKQQQMVMVGVLVFVVVIIGCTTMVLKPKNDKVVDVGQQNQVAVEDVTITSEPEESEQPETSMEPGSTEIPEVSVEPESTPINEVNSEVSATTVFSDSAFIGDSRTEGLLLNTGLKSAKFITARGLTVSGAIKDQAIRLENGNKGTVIDALKEGSYKKIFVMFGINELGWPYLQTFIDHYMTLINEIKTAQPQATIYIQSIIPVTKEKSDKDAIYNNKNIEIFDNAVQQMAKDNNLIYLNVKEAVVNQQGILPSEATNDGIHLKRPYCEKWLDYLKKQFI